MTLINPERERQRLAEHYATLTDEELEALSTELDQLTETAQGALREEMTQRHLEFQATEPQRAEPQELARPVVLGEYPNLNEAELAQEDLEAARIPSFISSPKARWSDPFNLHPSEPVKVWVNEGDLKKAVAELAPRTQEGKEGEEGLAEEERYRCPFCRSDDLTLQAPKDGDSDSEIVDSSVDAQSPRKWLCNACGKEWEESSTETQPDSQ